MKNLFIYLIIPIFSLLTACSAKNEPIIVKFKGASSEKKWAIKELNHELPLDW